MREKYISDKNVIFFLYLHFFLAVVISVEATELQVLIKTRSCISAWRITEARVPLFLSQAGPRRH